MFPGGPGTSEGFRGCDDGVVGTQGCRRRHCWAQALALGAFCPRVWFLPVAEVVVWAPEAPGPSGGRRAARGCQPDQLPWALSTEAPCLAGPERSRKASVRSRAAGPAKGTGDGLGPGGPAAAPWPAWPGSLTRHPEPGAATPGEPGRGGGSAPPRVLTRVAGAGIGAGAPAGASLGSRDQGGASVWVPSRSSAGPRERCWPWRCQSRGRWGPQPASRRRQRDSRGSSPPGSLAPPALQLPPTNQEGERAEAPLAMTFTQQGRPEPEAQPLALHPSPGRLQSPEWGLPEPLPGEVVAVYVFKAQPLGGVLSLPWALRSLTLSSRLWRATGHPGGGGGSARAPGGRPGPSRGAVFAQRGAFQLLGIETGGASRGQFPGLQTWGAPAQGAPRSW